MTETIWERQRKEGVLGLAMSRKTRDDFLRHRAENKSDYDDEFQLLASYISSDQCVRDLEALIRREYTMPPPFHYRIPKNFSGEKRDIYSFEGPVQYMLKLIAYTLRDANDLFSDGLYSFRTSVTAKDFLLKIRKDRNLKNYYCVKADVSNYVSSIVPELIIPKLTELFGEDPALLDLLKFLLLRRECIERDGTVQSCESGGLGGIPLANLFMNVYLMEADDYFYPRAPVYCRYSDDLVIFARSLEEAEDYRHHFLKILEQKKLHTNPGKTCLLAPGEEIELLGCKLKNGKMDMSDHAKRKLMRKIRLRVNHLLRLKKEEGLTDEECGRRMIESYRRIFFGQGGGHRLSWTRWLFPVIDDTSSLKELDHYVQDAIRYVMCGSFSKKRYRISYKRLKDQGYVSLVNAYYHGKDGGGQVRGRL